MGLELRTRRAAGLLTTQLGHCLVMEDGVAIFWIKSGFNPNKGFVVHSGVQDLEAFRFGITRISVMTSFIL